MPVSRSRGASVVLVVLALVAMLGHHCVMPLGAEAAAGGAHDHRGPDAAHGPGAENDGDTVHPSDCHVMATKAPTAAPAVVAVARAGLADLRPADVPRERAPVPLEPDRPPRYILHAALLI